MTKQSNDGYFEAYWPRGTRQQKTRALAPRLDTLEGKTVAQLWDYLFKGDEVFALLEEGLKKKYPGVKFVSWKDFGSTHSGDEKESLAALPQRFKELGVDAVISGMACWGSCTPAVLRASAACEAAGYPTSSLTCEGFFKQAAATSIGLGMRNIPLALVPGHIGTKSTEDLRRDILGVTMQAVVDNLTIAAVAPGDFSEPGARDIVVKGGFNEVNRYFYQHELSDGLPIVPPTNDAIDAFLRYTDRDPDEVLGVLLPDRRAATVWNVAVNGVMAGCRPEYMPVLIALIEAMCDPQYGVEHSGNTPGGDTLIILNGPIIKELDFNYTQGALRDGFLPNTSVGRFWRLYMRNVAGFLLHKTDKATFGNTWRVVLAENEDVLKAIGWQPTSVEMGFKAGDNTVTIARYTGGGSLSSVTGSTPEEMLPYLADSLVKFNNWQITFTTSHGPGTLRPLAVISPIIAETIAKAGWKKSDVKKYLFEHARITAFEFERQLRDWNIRGVWDLKDDVVNGRIPKVFYESDDPNRKVPIVWKPEDFMIAVGGDPMRNNAYVFAHNGFLGFPTGKKIQLPKNWEKLLAERPE